MDFDNNNLFSLNGQALMETGTNNEFRTIIDTRQKITRKTNSSGEYYFEVTMPDGTKKIYGKTANARVSLDRLDPSNGNVLDTDDYQWLLEEIVPPGDGGGLINNVKYSYTILAHGEALLDKVEYANDGQNYNVEVNFTYAERDDKKAYFIRGRRVNQTRLLTKIESIYNGQVTPAFSYEFIYAKGANSSNPAYEQVDDGQSRLIKIKKKVNGTEINSTLFSWGEYADANDFTGFAEVDYFTNRPNMVFDIQKKKMNAVEDDFDFEFAESKLAMDINNDGVDDFLTLEYHHAEGSNCTDNERNNNDVNEFKIYKNIYTQNGNWNRQLVVNTFLSNYRPHACRRSPFARIYQGDFNGDGLADFLLHRAQIQSNINEYYVDIYLNDPQNPGSFVKKITKQLSNHYPLGDWIDYDLEQPNNWFSRHPFYSILVYDHDGDGLSDFSFYAMDEVESCSLPDCKYYRIHYAEEMQGWSSQLTFTTEQIEFSSPGITYNLIPSDFTGDGKLDFMLLKDMRSEIWQFKDRTTLEEIYDGGFPTKHHVLKPGDFNGDGITDVLSYVDGYGWKMNYFDGQEFVWPQHNPSFTTNTIIRNFFRDGSQMVGVSRDHFDLEDFPYVFVVDVDQDGRQDIVEYKYGQVEVNYSKNSFINENSWETKSFSFSSITGTNGPVTEEVDPNVNFSFMDLKGDGTTQMVLYYNDKSEDLSQTHSKAPSTYSASDMHLFHFTFARGSSTRKVDAVLNGFNQKIEIEYGYGTTKANYSFTGVTSYPRPTARRCGNLVNHVKRYDFKDNLIGDIEYHYSDLSYHSLGMGMQGYKTVEKHNLLNNQREVSEYDWFNFSAPNEDYGVFHLVSKTQEVNSVLVSKLEQDYSSSEIASGVFSIKKKLSTQVSRDYLKDIATRTYNFYDAHDNLQQQSKFYYNNASGTGQWLYKENTDYNNFTQAGGWYPNKPLEVVHTYERDGEPVVTETIDYTYNSSSGTLKSKTTHPNSALAKVTENFSYHSTYGLLRTGKTVQGIGMAARSTSKTYTNDYRFVKTETNPLNWVTTYDYDLGKEQLTKETDPNGFETSYIYDALGRVTEEENHLGNKLFTTYSWFSGSSGTQELYRLNQSGDGVADTREIYDGSERIITEGQKNAFNQWVNTATEYNAEGQVKRESLPYFGANPTHWKTISYDQYGRTILIESPTNSTSVSYNNNSTTTTNDNTNQSKTVVYDAVGNKASVTDNGGTVTYTYNSRNQAKDIISPSGTTVIQYDTYGRQTSLNDPAAGVTSYQYNALGEITSQTDAIGNTYQNFNYDALGRVTSKDGPEGTYTYNYDDQFKGLIDSEVSPYGPSIEYSYNTNGLLFEKKEVIDGTYLMRYEYDVNGQLSKRIYPNNLSVHYIYDSHGQGNVMEVRDAQSYELLWERTSENHFGQIEGYKLGQSDWTEVYNAESGLPEFIGNNHWSFSYDFDAETGNLSSRTRNGQLAETFEYDNLDRLTDFTHNGQLISMQYAANGSITQKTDIGEYSNTTAGQTEYISPNAQTPISEHGQSITYTPFNSIATIMENGYEAFFLYGVDQQRRKMTINQNGNPYLERIYSHGGLYETETQNGVTRTYSYIPTPNGTKIVFYDNPQDPQNSGYLFFATDYQNSIWAVMDQGGNIREEMAYDPWGNRRDATTGNPTYLPGTSGQQSFSGLLFRGYTLHEHLDIFGLINMNGRLYDPQLGRMLSPDNFVQNPSSTQNFNRYSYVLNNPLKYTDPSGELAFLAAVAIGAAIFGTTNVAVQAANGNINNFWDGAKAFGAGAIAGAAVTAGVMAGLKVPILKTVIEGAGWAYASSTALSAAGGLGQGLITGNWTSLANTGKILAGNFYLDGNRGLLGQAWQGISRFSWEGIQSTVGHSFAQVRNAFGGVSNVDYFGGVTLANRNRTEPGQRNRSAGVTLGNFILGTNLEASINDGTFLHEFGHTLQSKRFGLAYPFAVAIPSGISCGLAGNCDETVGRRGDFEISRHNTKWYELQANRIAARYFARHFNVIWNDDDNPRQWP